MKYSVWIRQNYTRIIISLLITAVFILNSAGQLPLLLIDRFEGAIYDTRIRLKPEQAVSDSIVIIDIDENSLSREGHWPWSRAKLRSLLDNLFDEYGIALLAMDMVFAERDSSEVLENLDKEIAEQKDDKIIQTLNKVRNRLDTDNIFAQGLKDRPVVLGYYFNHTESDSVEKGLLPAPALRKDEFDGQYANYLKASGYGANIDVLQHNANGGGFFENPIADSDGVFRRAPMLQLYNGELYSSLSLAAAQAFLGRKPELTVKQSNDGSYQSIEEIRLGSHIIPVDDNASSLIPFRGKQGRFRYISAADILNKTLEDPYSLIGQIAFLGTTAPGLVDSRPTPIQNIFPGVEIHANLMSGILNDDFKHRPTFANAAEILILLTIGLILSFSLPALSPLWATLMVVLVLGGTIQGNFHLWSDQHIVLTLAQPVILILALFLFNMSYGFLSATRSKRHLGKLFGQYVPPELVDEMSIDPGHYSVEGERRELTVLFSDIRNFTSISEKLDPTELSDMLNEYLTPMTGIIHHSRGTIDKYMGDAVMAFWGAPQNDSNHAQHALEAAIEMQLMAEKLRVAFVNKGWPEIHIGIGLNTGEMNVGNMGSEFRMAYTILGDAVNLGARLEGLTKQYGVQTILSEYTRDAIEGYVYRELDRVRVKGKKEPVTIFEPICKIIQLSDITKEQLNNYAEALNLYHSQSWDAAESLLKQLQSIDPECILYRLYTQRIEEFRLNPPGENWDGIFSHISK
jgi:adenylate cyclase